MCFSGFRIRDRIWIRVFSFINITRRLSSRGPSMAIVYLSLFSGAVSVGGVYMYYNVVADYYDQSLCYLYWTTSTILGGRDP
ncbi:hypothetical protein HYPSUDRAFT_912270 [Hypholoma sublateritium FD-334 SS-4]|uniref:Uncharacterized protein n=1 Tax=Hypholoma sublateritium (strain FD-334 SS-4) TaxID=945553 RepID=A0A0D2PFL4_HYPSF|nr:hypothetical protein HYPSUDRAFT_912270 [Hypholoma sublateritium FD-334 SS-4]